MVANKVCLFAFGALCSALIYTTKIYLNPYKSPSSFIYFVSPSSQLEHFTFGYQELIADYMWIRTIQDFDQCDHIIKENEECVNSWVYKMVDKITDLSPKFRIIYATVPMMMSIAIKDNAGAVRIVEKGLNYYPNDWPILYRAAYLYLFEKNDKKTAADYFVRAQKNGGPEWLASIGARLYSEAGRLELAKQLIDDYSKSGIPNELLQRMKDHLLKSTSKMK